MTIQAKRTDQVSIEQIGGSITMAGWCWTEAVAERNQLLEQLAERTLQHQTQLDNAVRLTAENEQLAERLAYATTELDKAAADCRDQIAHAREICDDRIRERDEVLGRLAIVESANQSLQSQSQQAFDFLAELNEWVVSRKKEIAMTETEKKPMTREEMESRLSWLESCLNDGDAGRFFTMEKLLVMQRERDHLRELLAVQKGEAVASCEQQARDMIERMSSAVQWSDPQQLTASDVVELANLIAEVTQLRRQLATVGSSDDFAHRLKTLTILTKITIEASRLDNPVQRLTRILDIIGTFEG